MTMNVTNCPWQQLRSTKGVITLLGATLVLITLATRDSEAGIFKFWRSCQGCNDCGSSGAICGDTELSGEAGGTMYWLRSPEEEKRVVTSLYNRYCIRCHGVDGRGIWDIPDVPDFTNTRWQASRSDAQLARLTLEGRGAVMPAFRGTLTLEEAWAMARYIRTLVPETGASRPDLGKPEKAAAPSQAPAPK